MPPGERRRGRLLLLIAILDDPFRGRFAGNHLGHHGPPLFTLVQRVTEEGSDFAPGETASRLNRHCHAKVHGVGVVIDAQTGNCHRVVESHHRNFDVTQSIFWEADRDLMNEVDNAVGLGPTNYKHAIDSIFLSGDHDQLLFDISAMSNRVSVQQFEQTVKTGNHHRSRIRRRSDWLPRSGFLGTSGLTERKTNEGGSQQLGGES